MLFVAVVLFMIGFWTGLIPTDVFATAGISGILGAEIVSVAVLIKIAVSDARASEYAGDCYQSHP